MTHFHGVWAAQIVHDCRLCRWLCCIVLFLVIGGYLSEWLYFSILPVGEPTPDAALVSFLRTLGPPAEDQPVLLAESNARFHPMTRWWIDGLKALHPPVTQYAIVALDPQERDRLLALKQTVIHNAGNNMNYTQTSFRTKWYNQIVRYKWQIVVDVLRSGRPLLLSDVDIHWRRNPLPYLATLPQCDLYFGTDMRDLSVDLNTSSYALTPPFPGDGFTNWVNTGFMLMRPRPAVIALAKRVLLRPLRGKDDQYTLNFHLETLYKRHKASSRPGHDGHSCGNYGGLTFHFLRPDLFPNRLLYEKYPLCRRDYYLLHCNFLGDFTEKMAWMTQQGLMAPSYSA
eukprot:EG_transcript_14299